MQVFIDTQLPHAFWGSPQIARRGALVEAANTGGIILEVRSIEIRESSLVFIGLLPTESIDVGPGEAKDRIKISASGYGSFHTTWGSLIRPEGTIGFFVMRRPVTLVGRNPPNGVDIMSVAMEVKRCFASIPPGFIGPVCCIECNEMIPSERLRAVLGVRTCMNCQLNKEGGKKWKVQQMSLC